MRNRAPLNLTTSPEAHDGWRSFGMAHGVTMTALAEALGVALGALDSPEADLPDWLAAVVVDARRIAASRSDRSQIGP